MNFKISSCFENTRAQTNSQQTFLRIRMVRNHVNKLIMKSLFTKLFETITSCSLLHPDSYCTNSLMSDDVIRHNGILREITVCRCYHIWTNNKQREMLKKQNLKLVSSLKIEHSNLQLQGAVGWKATFIFSFIPWYSIGNMMSLLTDELARQDE